MRILDQDHRGYTGTRNGGYQGLECYNDSMILDVETLGKRNIEDWSAGTLGIGDIEELGNTLNHCNRNRNPPDIRGWTNLCLFLPL